jgi:hypothetical protein
VVDEERSDDYLDDDLADEVARILYREHHVDPANIPDQIFDRYPDFAADEIQSRGLRVSDPLPLSLLRPVAEAVARRVARLVREAEADTTTRYTVWDVPASAVMPQMLATNLTCSEAMAFRAEREDDEDDGPSGLLIYPDGQAWWEWED